MNILMTGVTGYLGSRIASRCCSDGHQVVALKRKTSSLEKVKNIEKDLVFFDVEDIDYSWLFSKFHFDLVLHCSTCYGHNKESISEMLESNIVFPTKILDAAINAKVPFFINTDTAISSDVNAYALSKKQFRNWGIHYSDNKEITFINIILEHFYGPFDSDVKFLTRTIHKMQSNVSPLEFTDGWQCRDFIYIEDVIEAYMIIFKHLSEMENIYFKDIDVGSGRAIPIRELVKLSKQLTKSSSEITFGSLPYRNNEVMFSCADISFLLKEGWRPTVKLQEGINKIINEEKI